jgi:hypothetical protein
MILKILSAALVGTVVYFLLGWAIFEGVLGKFTAENTTQIMGFKKIDEEASMLLILVSCAAYALLLAIIMGYFMPSINLLEGIKLGAIVGILVATMTNTYWYATSHFYNNPLPLLLDIAAAGFTVGIMGGAIAWVLSAFK